MKSLRHPRAILAMIARHFRILWRLHEGRGRGLKGNDLAQAAGCHPAFLSEYEQDSRRFPPRRLGAVMEAVHRTERALKSSRLAERIHLDELVMDVCLVG